MNLHKKISLNVSEICLQKKSLQLRVIVHNHYFIYNAVICMQITVHMIYREIHIEKKKFTQWFYEWFQNMSKFALNVAVYTVIVLWTVYTKILI